MNALAIVAILAALRTGDRVILIGDSEAFLLAHEFPALAKKTGVSFKAIVRPGSSVISWARSPDWARVRGARPDVLLVSLGANDSCMGARMPIRLTPTAPSASMWVKCPR